jgi:hypothetical protein
MLLEHDAHDLRRAFLHGLLSPVRIQVCRREARIDRVYGNALVLRSKANWTVNMFSAVFDAQYPNTFTWAYFQVGASNRRYRNKPPTTAQLRT